MGVVVGDELGAGRLHGRTRRIGKLLPVAVRDRGASRCICGRCENGKSCVVPVQVEECEIPELYRTLIRISIVGACFPASAEREFPTRVATCTRLDQSRPEAMDVLLLIGLPAPEPTATQDAVEHRAERRKMGLGDPMVMITPGIQAGSHGNLVSAYGSQQRTCAS